MLHPSPEYTPPIADRLYERKTEIAGITVKCVVSNIRRPNIDWQQMQLIPGLGREGNLVVVEAKISSGYRTEVEDQQGRDERIYQGDRFVAVLANRHTLARQNLEIFPQKELKLKQKQNYIYFLQGAWLASNQAYPPKEQNQWH